MSYKLANKVAVRALCTCCYRPRNKEKRAPSSCDGVREALKSRLVHLGSVRCKPYSNHVMLELSGGLTARRFHLRVKLMKDNTNGAQHKRPAVLEDQLSVEMHGAW